jgi:excisionase family DNA binding protein
MLAKLTLQGNQRQEHAMQDHPTAVADEQPAVQPSKNTGEWRTTLRAQTLANALRKRDSGVPSLSVPEAAALMSISQEYLYRLIQLGAFPGVRMRAGRGQGRYVVPTKAVDRLLDYAAETGTCVESAEFATQWAAGTTGGAR